MSAAVIRIILLVSIAMGTGINQPQESIDENHPRDLNKLLEKFSDKNLEMDEINEIEQDDNSETEMVNKEQNILIKESKLPKQLSPTDTKADKDNILDEIDNQKLLSMLNLDSDNDQENIPNLQVVLNSSVFVRGALRKIFEKIFTNPQTLMDTPVADLEEPDVRTRMKFSKTYKTLEAMAELQASNDVQNALAELQASNIVQQAITELRSSNAVQNALQEFEKSPAIQQVITGLQSSNAVKKRLEEGLSLIQMIKTEASESVQKAIVEDSEVLQKALAGLQITNVVQDAVEGLRAFSGAQETMDKTQTSNEVQEAMEELMALNTMEEAIGKDQDAVEFQKNMIQDFLSEARSAATLQDDIEELQNLEDITITIDKTENESAIEKATLELQDSSILKEMRMDVDAHIANVQESMSKNKATDSVEKSDAEEPNDME